MYAVASEMPAVPQNLQPAEQPVGGFEPTEQGFVSQLFSAQHRLTGERGGLRNKPSYK